MSYTTRDSGAWLQEAVGYLVYLPSFYDTTGNGMGDLAGVTKKLDYLHSLGINLLWISPFFPSPMADFGYDVADYCEVDPRFGDLEDIRQLIGEAHRRKIRIVLDLVPNHTSIQHKWFRQALTQPEGPYRRYYHWRDPAPDGGPPNNWVSYFGGPAWTLDKASGQYYLHLFLPDQPDLNWRNPDIRSEFRSILRFWLDYGVDGFRIDVAQGMMKNAELLSNPQVRSLSPNADRIQQWEAFDHLHDVLQPETLEIFQEWHELCATYDAVLLGETHVLDPKQFAGLVPGGGLDVGFWFGPIDSRWGAREVRRAIQAPFAAGVTANSIGWLLSSQDEARSASRFGGGDLGKQRALALATLLFCLPGLPFLYQGDELGLIDGIVAPSERADPVGATVAESRDGCRTPMPWGDGPNFGFSTSSTTWLPHGGRTLADTAAAQQSSPQSWLHLYRTLIRTRRESSDLQTTPLQWLDLMNPDLVAYQRGSIKVVANLGDESVEVAIPGQLLFSTFPTTRSAAMSTTQVRCLRPAEVLVIKTKPK